MMQEYRLTVESGGVRGVEGGINNTIVCNGPNTDMAVTLAG